MGDVGQDCDGTSVSLMVVLDIQIRETEFDLKTTSNGRYSIDNKGLERIKR